MASTGPSKGGADRSSPALSSSQRSSYDISPKLPRKSHSTPSGAAAMEPLSQLLPDPEPDTPDAFDTNQDSDNEHDSDGQDPGRGSIDLDDLPIELVSLTDSFFESLTSKTHKNPPTIDNVSLLFQEFYQLASSHVNTHISALATRQTRGISPAQTTKASPASRLRAKAASIGTKDGSQTPAKGESAQQMITTDELVDKRKARRALEAKRSMLEEAVERRLCEGVYTRIYRHKSTQDEAQDDKLRSKTAALALVGISPVDLGIDLGDGDGDNDAVESEAEALASETRQQQKVEGIRESLGQARKDLIMMNEKRYPLGKLNHLKAAHKSIVDTLAQFHPSASADEIMPMLIYTLITLPPEHLNVISDVRFIQYFRWEPKLTGEAAYCLTNLEAAISFLETVDLSTLRGEELPQGSPKDVTVTAATSATVTPTRGSPARSETFPPSLTLTADGTVETTPSNVTATDARPSQTRSVSASSGLKAAVQGRNRRISELVNTPAQAIGAASDAVFNTADQGLQNITNSLGDSYKFLVGKLRETQGVPTVTGQALVVPRTLDDARKLVSTPPPGGDGALSDDGDEQAADNSNYHDNANATDTLHRPPPRDDKVLNLIGGRKTPSVRDHSADSARSGGAAGSLPSNAGNPLENAVRNFGNSFNPIGRLSSMNVMRFGRAANASPAGTSTGPAPKAAEGGDLSAAFPDIAPALPPKEVSKVKPPNKRFMELQNPGDLKLGEVLDLLRDYRRLAGALKDRDAFEGGSK